MHTRRLAFLLALAALAAVPEALVRSGNDQIGFQTWLVLQLLGVIVAALAVAAMFSVLGLGIVRLLTRPMHDRPSTFIAWSFLRAPRLVRPLPMRLWSQLCGAVDAVPDASLVRPWRWLPIGVGLAVAGVAGVMQWGVLDGGGDAMTVALRNFSGVLALHGTLIGVAGLPWPRVRRVLMLLVLTVAAVAGAWAARHPLVLQWFDAPWALGTLAVVVAFTAWRAGSTPGLATRLQQLGQILLPVGLSLLVAAAVAFGVAPRGLAVPVGSVAVVAAIAGLYLVLQGQAKVSLPVFVSIVGVAAGTWALIVVLSVMGGFASDLRAKMLVANAHALVERPGRAEPLDDAARIARALRALPGVAGVSPQVRGDAILSSAFNVNNFVAVRGVDVHLDEVRRELGGTLVTGSLRLLQEPASLGTDRALVRRPVEEDSDLPPAPALVPSSDSQPRERIEDLLRMAPGPATPAPPQLAPPGNGRPAPKIEHGPLLLPSDEPERLAPAADPDAAGPGELPSDANALPDVQMSPPAPPKLVAPDLGRMLGDDTATLPGESVDVPVAPGILLGSELARSLQVELGDRIEVVTPDADVGPTGLRPRVRTFRLAGTFETGLYEADSKVAYIDLGEAARYFNLDGDANVLELRLVAPEQPDAVVAAARAKLKELGAPDDVQVLDWRALNRSLFSALAFERLVIFLVLGLIILVAAFSIVSALTMVILQKRDSIAMLRAMGSSAGAIRSSFVQMGGVIGLIGTMAGGILGIGTCTLIQTLGIQLPEAYYVRTLPVNMQIAEIAVVALASVAVSLVATVFPATSAARLSPLEGLRHG